MKASELYQKAFDDVTFLRQKLDDLHFLRTVMFGMYVFSWILVIAGTLFLGLKHGKWLEGIGIGSTLLIIMCAYREDISHRVAALEAIARRQSQTPLPEPALPSNRTGASPTTPSLARL